VFLECLVALIWVAIYRLQYGSRVTIGTVRVTLWISVRVVEEVRMRVRVRTG
jgi:hypothetical protein